MAVTQRLHVLAQLAGAVPATARVLAIDGVDGAGKTTFADDLADVLRARLGPAGRRVVRASVDDFHHRRAVRYRSGRDSPLGYFEDSYDYDALRSELLDPFRAGRPYRRVVFDHRTDSPVDSTAEPGTLDAVLILDGIFLHRDELRLLWDFSAFLRVPFAETFARMAVRDGSPADPQAPANLRYAAGQRIYLSRCSPESRATVVVDNTDVDAPRILTSVGVTPGSP